jgi:transposase InsO family protein
VDDYSRFTWVFFLQDKSQTQETLKGFLRRAQNEFGLRIKKIRSDNGTEFKNSQIKGFLEDEGIKHEFSSPYTPQQNGVVERKNRTCRRFDPGGVPGPTSKLSMRVPAQMDRRETETQGGGGKQ